MRMNGGWVCCWYSVAAKSNRKPTKFFIFCSILQIAYNLVAAENKISAAAATARTPAPEPTTAEKAAREAAEKARRAAKDATEAAKAADAAADAATPKPEPKSWMEWMTGQTDPAEQKKTIAVVVITALVSRLKVFR